VKVTLDGKAGQRSPLLIPSVPYLQKWLDVHPARNDATAPLWSKLDEPVPVTYEQRIKMIRKPGLRAGITHTPITYTRMRKSSASYLASQNVNQAHLEQHHGWKRGSTIASRYIAVFSEANDLEIARAHGVDVHQETADPTAPLTCPRCRKETPRHEGLCVWCGQALSQAEAEKAAKQDSEIRRAIATAGDPEIADAVVALGDLLDKYPELRAVMGDADREPSG